MKAYCVLLTNSTGIYFAENKERCTLYFSDKSQAELLACRLAPFYNLVQVVSYKLSQNDRPYVFATDFITEIDLLP